MHLRSCIPHAFINLKCFLPIRTAIYEKNSIVNAFKTPAMFYFY